MRTKVIFFTGGVCSSIGKGLILANIGRLFQEFGFKVSAIKFDPYLNLTAGNLSPSQHGEVYVTDDGCETDLDLGHYERFMNYKISRLSCITSGFIYKKILDKQDDKSFSGETVQVIPHLIDEIHAHIDAVIKQDNYPDILLIEIGGTVGDIESIPFLEAASRLKNKYGSDSVLFIHVSPLVYISASKEYKTKPTQHSIKSLNGHGISPDFLILRSVHHPKSDVKRKIFVSTNLNYEDIFLCLDSNIYLILESFYEQNIHLRILDKLGLVPKSAINIDSWREKANKILAPKTKKIILAIVAKYTTVKDSYISISESFQLAAYELGIDLEISYIDVEKISNISSLSEYDAVCVPYGFGSRGVEEYFGVIKYCREQKIPFLGICFGMQLSCIEYARNVLNIEDVNSLEMNPNAKNPLFIPFEDGQMRLGAKKIAILDDTLAKKIFKTNFIFPRHRHRYYLNPKYLSIFINSDFVISAYSDDEHKIPSLIELKNHPFFMASQFHPEFGNNLNNISPLFIELLRSSLK